ncbi:hypothetical protein CR205_18865 [Alteribacter lacisalsi]|uniref:Uncharacterized protein n=1 Tax=Alteribacter lacisalsi TaxID=2045244 RepID=A0A2W0H1A8_9BACI|nr:hypothetical protein [Alteribacter lacisalsi]PYZ95583.1 hypothetical protein CR205_18865 [Alteribacter lacisalsi]
MFGLMLNAKETQEMEYLLKRELEELLLDLTDSRIEGIVKRAMEERYQIIFRMYKRFVKPQEYMKYVRHNRSSRQVQPDCKTK